MSQYLLQCILFVFVLFLLLSFGLSPHSHLSRKPLHTARWTKWQKESCADINIAANARYPTGLSHVCDIRCE